MTTNQPLEQLGALIRQGRLQAGLTQEQMARKLDVTLRQYVRWENGESKIAVDALAKWLEITKIDYQQVHVILVNAPIAV